MTSEQLTLPTPESVECSARDETEPNPLPMRLRCPFCGSNDMTLLFHCHYRCCECGGGSRTKARAK